MSYICDSTVFPLFELDGCMYDWICRCGLHQLIVVVASYATVTKHRMKNHHEFSPSLVLILQL